MLSIALLLFIEFCYCEYELLGVPYALPPRRWKPPQPVSVPFVAAKHVNKLSPVCTQDLSEKVMYDYTFPNTTTMSEDCLYLNIWSPADSPRARLPVMVWIHGGGLSQGGNCEVRLNGKNMSQLGNVVVVNLNYRLGVFGFLALPELQLEDPNYPATGNYGLEDQRLALQWVVKNIGQVGGDNTNITIMGESAGGTSVSLHLLMQRSKGLFHRAIVESNALFAEVRNLTDGFVDGNNLVLRTGCQSSNPVSLLLCLRNLTPAVLLANQDNNFQTTAYVDKYNLMEHPFKSVFQGKVVNQVPTLIGSNLNEGSIFVFHGGSPWSIEKYNQTVETFFHAFAPLILYEVPCVKYNASDCRFAYSQLFGDFALTCPTYFTAQATSAHRSTYYYLFSHHPYYARSIPFLGSYHSAEVAFVFSNQGIYETTPEELVFENQITALWTNFGKTGNPNLRSNVLTWPQLDYHGTRLDLNLNSTLINSLSLSKRCEFYQYMYQFLYNF